MTLSISAETVERNKELVYRLTVDGFNEGNLDGVENCFGEDYEVHAPGIPPLPRGAAAFRMAVTMWRGVLPDMQVTIDDIIGENDTVYYRRTTTGTHLGPFMGIEPTGKSITVHGMECHRVVDGRVTESWIGDDVPSILFQVGAATVTTDAPEGPHTD